MDEYIKIVTDLSAFSDRVVEITSKDSYDRIKHVVSQLKRALYQEKDCPALCAPQIGESLRLFVVKTAGREHNKFKVILNPMIVKSEGLHLSREMSASIPGVQFIIPRRDKIHVAYQTEDGHVNSETFTGAFAEVMQQMIEMLDGITLDDYGLELDKKFDKATKKKQAEIIDTYLTVLKEEYNVLTDEIKNNEELNDINKTIDFMTGILTGDIKPINPVKVDKDGNETPLEMPDTAKKEVKSK